MAIATLDRCNKPISPSRQSLDKPRVLRRVPQHFANLIDGCVEVVIDVNEGVGPEALLQFVATYYFTRSLQKNCQHLKRLAGEFQLDAAFA